jgi:tetratricopeptide (TPR) repeat protein
LNPVQLFNFKRKADRAIEELSRAVRIHPEGTVWVLYGQLLMFKGRLEEAEEAFLRGAEAPSMVPVRRAALYNAAVCAAIRGGINGSDRDVAVLDRALRHIRALLALGDVRPDQADELSIIALKTGQLDLARALVAMWERQAPTDLKAVRRRARVELEGGAYGRALEAANRVLAPWPQDQEALDCRAKAIERAREEARRLPAPDKGPPE